MDENFGELSREGQKDYDILTQFHFDQTKQRNSIVLFGKTENSEPKVIVYSRGSVRGIKPVLKRSSEPDFEVGVAKLKKDREFGFKCHIFARKEMSVRDFVRMVTRVDAKVYEDIDYDRPLTSLRKMLTTVSQANIEVLRGNVEKDLEFLGSACTKEFIESQLQESFDFFFKAGINIWIVSEDSVNTCIYFSRRLNLVGANSQTKIVLTMEHPDDLSSESINNFKTRIESARNDPNNFCLAVSGQCLSKLFKIQDTNPNLYSDFLELLFAGGLTIFGGLNPLQKKQLVDLFRKENPEQNVLAVGDGPEDQLMLSSAHIGVNIFKGQQYLSCRSADVYLQKFHQLRSLMFGFGTEAYRKSVNIFHLGFYISILLVVPEIVTAPFSYFFPRRLLPDWVSSIIAIVLPAFAMILYAANDTLFDHEQMIKCTGVYEPSKENKLSSWQSLLRTAVNALVSGVVLTLLALALFDFGTYKDGQFFGWFSFGNMVTLGLMLLIFIRIFSVSNTFSFLLLMVPVSMVLVYFFIWLLMSFISGSNLFDSFMEIILSPQLYVFVPVVICLGVAEYLFLKVQFYSFLSEMDFKQNFQEGGVKLKNPKYQSESDGLYNKNNQEDLMKDDYRESSSESD
jgi:magnesium-transporting ATPase (P-type)